MKAIYDVNAPAKLNLFLHITGRRADGYHLLQSVFMLIDWCDRLQFESRTDGQISREDLSTRLPPDDLIVRAAKALQTATGCAQGAHISIEKSIPAEAGMGGGSSDAATTLLALNRLWQLKLPMSMLVQIGLRLGADVPFFLQGRNAWVEGVGEKITPIEVPPARFLVVKPPTGLETARIFKSDQLKRDTETAILAGFAEKPFCFGRNDLQTVAQSLCPEVGTGLHWLESQQLKGRMTGSGSAVFAHLDSEARFDEAGSHEAGLGFAEPPAGFAVRVCKNLQEHPLNGWAS
jgi:4-diphosphocytidyl-2-C-methyl-D-erythritol kinase